MKKAEYGGRLKAARDEAEKRVITEVMREKAGNVMQVAATLGIGRQALYDALERHKIPRDVAGLIVPEKKAMLPGPTRQAVIASIIRRARCSKMVGPPADPFRCGEPRDVHISLGHMWEPNFDAVASEIDEEISG